MERQNRQDYFEAVYRDTFKRLSQYVYFKVASVSEAEDIVASVYTDFYQYIVLRDKRPENIQAYLTKMANHELARHYSGNIHPLSFDDESLNLSETVPNDSDTTSSVFEQIESAALWQAVQQLSAAEQQVIIAKFRFDLTFSEIALSQGQNESAVKLRFYRALRKLQKILQ